MSDLINREDVLKYPIRLDHYDEEHGNRHFVLGIESVMEYVESLPSAGQNCVICEYYTEIETDDGIKGKCTRRTGSDLISRQDAIEAIATVTMSIHLSNVLCDKLLALPSAEPKTGKWIGDRCSICGSERAWFGQQPDFCPDCGSRMRGDEE